MKKYDIYCALIVLYNDERKILLQHRTNDAKIMPGFWAFFGGGIKNGETPLEAVKRETKEELGYILKNPTLFVEQEFILENKKGYMFVYIEKYDGSKLNLNEGQGMGWFNEEDIKKIDRIIDHDRDVMKKISNFINKEK